MSKYKHYAETLSDSFKEARTAYNKAYSEMEEARKEYESSLEFHKEKKEGENATKQRRAELSYRDKEEKFKEISKTVWKEYEEKIKALGVELEADVRKDNVMKSDSVDKDALELLKSGLMSLDDYDHMVEQFAENSTMQKYISKYARESADNMKGPDETRSRLYKIADDTKDGRTKVLKEWDSLVDSASTYAGLKHSHATPDYINAISQKWEDGGMDSAVESF